MCSKRVAGHQVVGVLPTGQSSHALEPGAYGRVVLGDVKSELFGRIVQVAGHRDVCDGRPVANQKRSSAKPLVDDGEVPLRSALQERKHGRIASWLGEIFQETEWPEKAIHL